MRRFLIFRLIQNVFENFLIDTYIFKKENDRALPYKLYQKLCCLPPSIVYKIEGVPSCLTFQDRFYYQVVPILGTFVQGLNVSLQGPLLPPSGWAALSPWIDQGFGVFALTFAAIIVPEKPFGEVKIKYCMYKAFMSGFCVL